MSSTLRIDDLLACDLVWEYLGDGNWELVEVDSGWIVTWGYRHHVSSHVLFVERDSGALLLFPLGVSASDLNAMTPEVRNRAQEILPEFPSS